MSSATAAARVAARQASAVFKAVVQGPQAPAPAAWGVDLAEFQRALPWFSWRELALFANHFGQRQTVREEVAAALATELRRRLLPQEAPKGGGKAFAARFAREPREVVAVAYAFSKLKPQSAEYHPVFAGVAHGIERGAWEFTRMQAALLGTAFADVGLHLTDALPTLVRRGLEHRDSEVSIDELRYLLHACVALPRPGLAQEELEFLAASTKALAREATFSKASHLFVSWLQLCPPAGAKRAYLEALREVCKQLLRQVPQNPAHPLPAAGLAPAVAELLKREQERVAPPLTPPQFQQIMEALVQVGLGSKSEAALSGQSLSVNDWTSIAWLVVDFCEIYNPTPDDDATGMRPLPGWAAKTLGYIFSRAQQPTPHGPATADLHTVLSLLRLLRRYQPLGAPGPQFFLWARSRIIEEYERGGADPATLAEAVSELVPRLPQEERLQFAQIVIANPHSPLRPSLLAKARLEAMPRLLEEQSKEAPKVVLKTAQLTKPEDRQAKQGLWDLLAKEETPSSEMDLPAEAVFAAEVLEEPVVRPEATHKLAAAQATQHDTAARNEAPDDTVRLLHERLERALARVEALEARIEQSEQKRDVEAAAEVMSASPGDCWETPALPGGQGLGLATVAVGDAPTLTPNHPAFLRRPFNFEEFRRAESRRLQNERMRFVFPSDHFPMWPIQKK